MIACHRRTRARARLLAAATVTLMGAGRSRALPAQAPPAPRTVTAMCGGGITGGSGGTTLTSTGRLSRWTRRRAGAPAESTFVRVDTALARDLFARLDATPVRNLAVPPSSDRTCALTVRGKSVERSVSWSSMSGDASDPRVPTHVRTIFDLLQRAGAPAASR